MFASIKRARQELHEARAHNLFYQDVIFGMLRNAWLLARREPGQPRIKETGFDKAKLTIGDLVVRIEYNYFKPEEPWELVFRLSDHTGDTVWSAVVRRSGIFAKIYAPGDRVREWPLEDLYKRLCAAGC